MSTWVHLARRPDRRRPQWCELPDATFMNGCTMHPSGRTLLACESASGHILAIDLGQPGAGTCGFRGSTQADRAQMAGSNGIKIRQGWAWITVSGRRLMVRAPIQPDGSAGAIEIAATRLSADDFAFGCRVRSTSPRIPSTLWFASIPRRSHNLAGHQQGMVGSTACAFGRAPGDEKALYVTTMAAF